MSNSEHRLDTTHKTTMTLMLLVLLTFVLVTIQGQPSWEFKQYPDEIEASIAVPMPGWAVHDSAPPANKNREEWEGIYHVDETESTTMMSTTESIDYDASRWPELPPRKTGCSPKFTNKPRTRAPTGLNANPWQRWQSLGYYPNPSTSTPSSSTTKPWPLWLSRYYDSISITQRPSRESNDGDFYNPRWK